MFYPLDAHFKPLNSLYVPHLPEQTHPATVWMCNLHMDALERSNHPQVGLYFKHRPSQVKHPIKDFENGGAFEVDKTVVIYKKEPNFFRAVPVIFTIQHKPQNVDGYMLHFTPSLWPDVDHATDSGGEKLYPEIVTRRLDPQKIQKALDIATQTLNQDIQNVLEHFKTLPEIPTHIPDQISTSTLLAPYFNDKFFTKKEEVPAELKDDLTRIARIYKGQHPSQLMHTTQCLLVGRQIGQWGKFSPTKIKIAFNYEKRDFPSQKMAKHLFHRHQSFLSSQINLDLLNIRGDEITQTSTRHTQMQDLAWMHRHNFSLSDFFD